MYESFFSITTNKDAYDKFIFKRSIRFPKAKKPTDIDIEKKDKSNFMSFLKHSLLDLQRVCMQKNRNIRGTKELKVFLIQESVVDGATRSLIQYSPKKYGYRRVKVKELAALKKNMGKRFVYSDFEHLGKKYIFLNDIGDIQSSDFILSYYNKDSNIFMSRPDEVKDIEDKMIKQNDLLETIDIYKKSSNTEKIRMLLEREKQLTKDQENIRVIIKDKIKGLTCDN